MDANKILMRLRGESDRERISLYLSKSILKEFKDCCGDKSVSRVLEEMMREFVDSANNSTSKPKKASKKVKKN